jgi:hypothetical protein
MGSRLERIQETFGIDLRSLGVLRILLGVMLLVDYAVRAASLKAHYTDYGVLPTAYQEAFGLRPYPGRFSFHMWSGESGLQVFLFALAALFALALIIGYRTKISLLMSLVLMISVQNRNIEIETGGDYLLRLVVFWALFLPLGARFSLDARAGRARPDKSSGNLKGNQYFSVATIALIAQMAVVYFFSALHKNHPIWRVDHTAIHYALHIDSYDTWLGEILRQHRPLTAALTRLTLGFEFVAPWTIFGAGVLGLLPGLEKAFHPVQGSLRTLVTFSFVAFHVGLALSLSLGTFAWFAALIWLGLFPTWAWERLEDFRQGRLPVDPYAEPQADPKGKVDQRQADLPFYYKLRFPALLRALDLIEAFAIHLETPPHPKKTRRLLKKNARRILSGVSDAAAGVALFYVLLWNLSTLDRTYGKWISGSGESVLPDARPMIHFLRLDQHWGLFAPYPRTVDGYFVVLGQKKNGDEIDFLTKDHKVTWEKPDDVSGSFETFRWRKYFRQVRRSSSRQHQKFYTSYVCREWNAQHDGDDQLHRVTLYFMKRETLRKGGHKPTQKERLWVQDCGSANNIYRAPAYKQKREQPEAD